MLHLCALSLCVCFEGGETVSQNVGDAAETTSFPGPFPCQGNLVKFAGTHLLRFSITCGF